MKPPPHPAHEALRYYQRGDLRKAERAARTALAAVPRDPGLLQILAAILVAQNRPDEAIDLLQRVIGTGSATAEVHYNLGTALAMAGRHKEAAERLKHASIAKPRDADCQNNLGIALLFTGEHAQAEAAFGRALELRPGWPAALYNSGRAAAAQGKHQQALNSYS